jgi:hypothetical protein
LDVSALLRFVAQYEGLIYFVLFIAALFNARWLFRAWQDRRNARFGLEREFASQRFTAATGTMTLIIILFVGEAVVASFIAPVLPAYLATPTIDLLATPTGTLSPEMLAALSGTPNAESPFGATGCVPGQYVITSPRPNQEINQTVDLIGTVNVPNMGFYKFEVAPQNSDNWSTIFADNKVWTDASMGKWDTTELTPGDYRLRLIVTDNQGKELPPCIIPVRIVP